MEQKGSFAIEPTIKLLPEKKLVGIRMHMSLTDNRTFDLWRSFMPRRREIVNAVNPTALYSMQVYDPSYSFSKIDLDAIFEKRALVEVKIFDMVPEGMETFVLPEGLYAVFPYKGNTENAPQVFGYIYGTWLSTSGYTTDNRPHFELLGEKYKHGDPNSEEEIWIPIKK